MDLLQEQSTFWRDLCGPHCDFHITIRVQVTKQLEEEK